MPSVYCIFLHSQKKGIWKHLAVLLQTTAKIFCSTNMNFHTSCFRSKTQELWPMCDFLWHLKRQYLPLTTILCATWSLQTKNEALIMYVEAHWKLSSIMWLNLQKLIGNKGYSCNEQLYQRFMELTFSSIVIRQLCRDYPGKMNSAT